VSQVVPPLPPVWKSCPKDMSQVVPLLVLKSLSERLCSKLCPFFWTDVPWKMSFSIFFCLLLGTHLFRKRNTTWDIISLWDLPSELVNNRQKRTVGMGIPEWKCLASPKSPFSSRFASVKTERRSQGGSQGGTSHAGASSSASWA